MQNETKSWIIFIIILLISILLATFSQAAITDNLIAYYKFNESSPIRDSSGYQVDAVNFGADYVSSGSKFSDSYFNFTSTDKMNISGNFKSVYTGLSWGGFFKSNAIAGSATFGIDGHNGANQGFFLRFDAGGVVDCVVATGGVERSAASTYTTGTWQHFTCVFNDTNIAIYKNGVYVTNSGATGGMNKNTGSVCFGSYCTANLNYNGGIDSPFIYNRSITADEVIILNNSEQFNVTVISNNPPVVTFNNQDPANITVLNIPGYNLNITYNVTDEDINETSIKIEFILNNTRKFINGTEITLNGNFSYDAKNNKTYIFLKDESDIFAGSEQISHDLFDAGTLANATIQGLNNYLKMQFFNVSPYINASFVEIMDQNLTAIPDTSNYYYCNSSYVTGNVLNSPNCVLFASRNNQAPYNHTQGNSKHRILNLGIDTSTGKIGSVQVTPESFILKRGNVQGDVYFYLNQVSRQNTTQLSNNNGVTWNSQSYTVNAHIHQINQSSSIQYRVCANDYISQRSCSAYRSDIPDIPQLPLPNVNIYEPIATSYNGSIMINHSNIVDYDGGLITNYSYYYAVSGTSTYFLITTNIYPTNYYQWDITNLINQDYVLKVIARSSDGQISETYSEIFNVNNPLSVTEQLLTDIDDTLTLIYQVIEMIPFIMLYIFLTCLGFYMIKDNNFYLGLLLLFVSFGFDLYLTQWLYDNYVSGLDFTMWQGKFVWIFGVSLLIYVIGKFAAIFTVRQKRLIRV